MYTARQMWTRETLSLVHMIFLSSAYMGMAISLCTTPQVPCFYDKDYILYVCVLSSRVTLKGALCDWVILRTFLGRFSYSKCTS